VAADITLPTQFIKTKTVAGWKKAPAAIGKRPCVFIISA
jgi:16S rRNA (cytidine1402-2'-O)-methyltransferase